MYEYTYTCNTCQSRIRLQSRRPVHPLSGKVGLHSSFAGDADEVRAYYGIARIVSGVNQGSRNCHGTLRFDLDATEVRVAAAPAPRPRETAPALSLQYAAVTRADGVVNTVCAAVDISTGSHNKGVNAHRTSRANLHQELRARLDRVDRLEEWDTTNCAEIDAVNKLLNAGATLANIRVYSRDLQGRQKYPCENCLSWLTVDGNNGYRISP